MEEVKEAEHELFHEYKYKIELSDKIIACFILKLTDSYRIWIGSPMDLSLCNLYVNYGPLSTHRNSILLYSNRDDGTFGERVTSVLAAKLKSVVFLSVSCMIPEDQQMDLLNKLITIVESIYIAN